MADPQTPSPTPVPRSGRYPRAYLLFFPLACLYAAVAVPLWVAEWTGAIGGGCLRCDPMLRHGHEMLLGYAGAVIAGYLLTRVTLYPLALAALCWGLGRIAAWFDWGGIAAWSDWGGIAAWSNWGGIAAGPAQLAFPVVLFVLAGLPFWRAARTARNMVFAPLIGGFTLAEGLVLAGFGRRGILLAFDLTALLILVMGGRLIPAAMAGLVRREENQDLFDRNRPWLEWVCIAGLAVAAIGHLADLPGRLAAPGMLAEGIAAGMRQSRWRLRLALRDPSLGPLQLGYAALALGLVAAAAATWTGLWPAPATLHLATVAGIGIVTATMMLRTVHIRERRPGPFPRVAWPVAGMLLAAAALRVAAPLAMAPLLVASAGLWCAAFLLAGGVIAGAARRRP